MIWQCYYRPEQRARCWDTSPYCPLGVSPETNPRLTAVVPEVVNPTICRQVCEYQALLFVDRAKLDDDDWSGFTSWRQLEKSRTTFSPTVVSRYLDEKEDVVAWLVLNMRDEGAGSVAEQAERCHPGINDFLWRMSVEFPNTVTNDDLDFYRSATTFIYATYWATSAANLHRFVTWSAPLWNYLVAHHDTDPYLANNGPRPWSFFQERLFSIWMNKVGLTYLDLTRR